MISSFYVYTKKEVREKYLKLRKFGSQYLNQECDRYWIEKPIEVTPQQIRLM